MSFNNTTSSLTCDVSGFPEPNVHLEHFASNKQSVRIIYTTRKGIFLKTFEDSGIYRCSAENGVMSEDGLSNFSESIYIELEGKEKLDVFAFFNLLQSCIDEYV